jgi:hypothetical protein
MALSSPEPGSELYSAQRPTWLIALVTVAVYILAGAIVVAAVCRQVSPKWFKLQVILWPIMPFVAWWNGADPRWSPGSF